MKENKFFPNVFNGAVSLKNERNIDFCIDKDRMVTYSFAGFVYQGSFSQFPRKRKELEILEKGVA